jgi:RNA polymerase sigma-70 factor (ECF subfamily)
MQLLTIVLGYFQKHTTVEMIVWTTVGAFFPEIIRLYKMRTRRLMVESWSFFFVLNLFFPLLVGPALAAAFEPANVLGAIYTGASANVLLAAICSSVLEGQEEGLLDMDQQSKYQDNSPAGIAHLVRQAQEGNMASLEALFKATALSAQAVVSRSVPYDAHEDVLQEIRLRVYQTINQCNPDYFKAWLAVVARNVALDYMRRNKKAFSELSLDIPGEGVEALEKAADSEKLNLETLESIRTLLLNLSPQERKVVSLFYMYGYTYAEIAEHENISSKTVQTFLARARGKMKQIKL